jgi:hypothetical protein
MSYISSTSTASTISTYTSTSANVWVNNVIVGNGIGGYLQTGGGLMGGQGVISQPIMSSMDDGIALVHKIGPGTYHFDDGSVLHVDDKGNFRIEDKDAKITYQANNVREFNKYLNSSDLMADFIDDMGKLGADADQVLNIPLQYYIRWLVHKAAEADGETSDESLPEIAHDTIKCLDAPKRPNMFKCKHCGRFIGAIKGNNGMMFCNGEHADIYIRRISKIC